MAYTEYTTGVQPAAYDGDDRYSKIQGTRDGAIFTQDWVLARIAEGRGFVANAGTATAPITFGAGSIDTTEFDLHVSVPSGTTIIPIELVIKVEAWGTSAIAECMAVAGTGSTCGAGTSVTPAKLRTDGAFSSNCTVTSAATATSGVAITGAEFFRDGHIVAVTPATAGASGGTLATKFRWSYLNTGYAPIVVGAGQVGVFMSAQAGTGFISLFYVEVPSSRLT